MSEITTWCPVARPVYGAFATLSKPNPGRLSFNGQPQIDTETTHVGQASIRTHELEFIPTDRGEWAFCKFCAQYASIMEWQEVLVQVAAEQGR